MAIEFRTRSKAIQPDSEDIGACCTVAGEEYVCEDNVKYIDCKRNLGVFRGKDSTCSNQGCPGIVTDPETPLNSDLHGACKTCSSCTNNLLIEDCITQTNFDAEFFSNKLCSEVERDNLSSIVDTKHACCIQCADGIQFVHLDGWSFEHIRHRRHPCFRVGGASWSSCEIGAFLRIA